MFGKRMIQFTIFVCSFLIHSILYSQTHSLHFTTVDGLPSNKVYCAVQDAAGFMWFGTDNGLVRYNGSEFKTFTVKDGLPDNDIFSVFEDGQNRLWMLGFKQAPCYFFRNKLYTASNDSFLARYFKDPDMFRFTVNCNLKRILFYVIYKEKIAILEYGHEPNFNLDQSDPRKMIKCPVFNLFNSGRNDYLINVNTLYKVGSPFKSINMSGGVVAVDQVNYRQTTLGFYCEAGAKNLVAFRIMDDSFHVVKTYQISDCLGPYTNSHNDLIFVRESGEIYALDTSTLELVKENVMLPAGRISTACIDNKGNQWICTHDNGVYVYPRFSSEILSQNKGATCMIFNAATRTFVVGFENRLLLMLKEGASANYYEISDKIQRQSRITSMISSKESVWIGSDNKLVRFDLKTQAYHVYTEANAAVMNTVKDMELCSDGRILIGSANGAGYFNTLRGTIDELLWSTRTTAVCDIPSTGVFLGTINGLHYRATGQKEIKLFQTGTNLDKARITDIKYDRSGRVWVATAQFGVFILDGKKVILLDDNRDSKCFLTSYYVKNIFIDADDMAWLGTDKGINRVSFLKDGDCKVDRITTSFGIPNDNVSSLWVKGDTVYMTSLDGVFRFKFNEAVLREKPGLEITGLFVNGKKMPSLDGLNFSHFENNIWIEYSAIAFRSARNIEFDYRLKGSVNDWIRTRGNRIDLLGLEPGTYTFEIRAINAITGEKSAPRQVQFKILSPWYQTVWFILSVILLLVLLIWWLIKRRIKMIRRQAEEHNHMTKQFAELEMQALRAQMNPHFIFNAMSAIQNYFVNNKEEKANAYMAKFARLIRQMLDYSKDNFIPLDEEVSLLNNYMVLEKMRFENKLDFILDVDEQVDPTEYVLPSLLLQPILENAVNHGVMPSKTNGTVILRISREPDFLVCEIRDDGVGIHVSQAHKIQPNGHVSRGMDILCKRIESVNHLYNSQVMLEIYDLSESDGSKSGTRILLRFPLALVTKSFFKTS